MVAPVLHLQAELVDGSPFFLRDSISWRFMFAPIRRSRPIRYLLKNGSGATLVEYALLLSLVAVVGVTAVMMIGHDASKALHTAATSL